MDLVEFDIVVDPGTGRPDWGATPVGIPALTHAFIAEATEPVYSSDLHHRRPLERPEQLRHHTLLHTETRLTAWDDWLSLTGVTDIDATTGQRFETFYFLLQAAALGLGVAMAPDVLVWDDLVAGRLVAPFGFASNGMSMYVLYPKSRAQNARVLAFRDWLITAGQGGTTTCRGALT